MGKNGLEGKVDLPPGFRFFPTDEELVVQYLSKKVVSHPLPAFIIGEVDLYKYDPWQLPEKALFGEKEWYFFTPRDRKYPNGSRPNRAAGSGYWKATGADKPITTCGGKKRVGVKKALVFYKGKAPKGSKTNWIMHEYRLAEINMAARKKNTLRLDDWVLCRIYNKKSSAEKLAERKMMEATPAKEEDMPNTEDPKDDRNTMQTVLSEPSHDASTGRPGLASSSITGVVSSLPMNLGSEYQNPFYQQSAMNTPYNPARSSPAAAPSHQLNCNSIGGHATTNYGGSIASNLPSLILAEKDEVQSNFKLGNPVQKHEQGQGQGQSVQTGSPSFNFNFNGDGLQNPNFFSLDQTEASLKHPYQDFIDSIYNLQRGYQPSDMMLH